MGNIKNITVTKQPYLRRWNHCLFNWILYIYQEHLYQFILQKKKGSTLQNIPGHFQIQSTFARLANAWNICDLLTKPEELVIISTVCKKDMNEVRFVNITANIKMKTKLLIFQLFRLADQYYRVGNIGARPTWRETNSHYCFQVGISSGNSKH